MACKKDGTEKCGDPAHNDPCGWCGLIGCPQSKHNMGDIDIIYYFAFQMSEKYPDGCRSEELHGSLGELTANIGREILELMKQYPACKDTIMQDSIVLIMQNVNNDDRINIIGDHWPVKDILMAMKEEDARMQYFDGHQPAFLALELEIREYIESIEREAPEEIKGCLHEQFSIMLDALIEARRYDEIHSELM